MNSIPANLAMLMIQIEQESRSALETSLTARCLCKKKCNLASRLSRDVIPWANELADKACQALMRDLGRDESAFDKQVLMIQLRRNHAYFCFDFFLQSDGKLSTGNICRKVNQPIHEIRKLGSTYHMRRNKRLDQIIAAQYSESQKYNKGELPHFQDLFKAAVYDDGILVEDLDDLIGGGGDDDSDSKRGGTVPVSSGGKDSQATSHYVLEGGDKEL